VSERFALLESAEEIQFAWDQATAGTFFDMNGRTMLNVEVFLSLNRLVMFLAEVTFK